MAPKRDWYFADIRHNFFIFVMRYVFNFTNEGIFTSVTLQFEYFLLLIIVLICHEIL